jgi:ABC-type sugar transport system ATPase subunit
VIELRQVTLQAGQFKLPAVNLSIAAGEYAVLMGKTGSGKTTILEAVCGLRKVAAGNIWLHGREVTHLGPAERGLGYVPQDLALFPTMTVRGQLEFALRLRRMPRREIDERITELAALLGISALLERLPAGLSGGEAQRVALGRALSSGPPVLLLDEPLSALDEETRAEMVSLLGTVRKKTNVTVLHVTHSRTEAMALADRRFMVRDSVVSPGWFANNSPARVCQRLSRQ